MKSRLVMLASWETTCPECGGVAECDWVDVGVGVYLSNSFVCSCGWESDADGRMNVARYEDYFVDA